MSKSDCALNTVDTCCDYAMRPWSTEAFCTKTFSYLRDTLGYRRGAVVLRSFTTNELIVYTHCPGHLSGSNHDKEVKRVERLLNGPKPGVIKTVIAAGKPVVVSNAADHDAYVPGDTCVRSEICMPLWYNGVPMGAVNFEHPSEDFFAEPDAVLTKSFATLLSLHFNQMNTRQILGIQS